MMSYIVRVVGSLTKDYIINTESIMEASAKAQELYTDQLPKDFEYELLETWISEVKDEVEENVPVINAVYKGEEFVVRNLDYQREYAALYGGKNGRGYFTVKLFEIERFVVVDNGD